MKRGLAIILVLLAGCLGSNRPDADVVLPLLDTEALPPGCNANLTGISHNADMVLLDHVTAATIGCLSYIETDSWEPTIAIHPKSGAVYFHPAGTSGGNGQSDVARSPDQGATWQILSPNVAGQSTHPITVDPYMWIDPDTGRLFVDDLFTTHCSFFSTSDDEGKSWTTSAAGCTIADHISIFTGKPATSTTIGYPNVVYRCGISIGTVVFASYGAGCQKSLDGGRTFVNTGSPAFTPEPRPGFMAVPGYCDGGAGHGIAGPDGTIYLPKGLCGVPMIAISDDEGLTWTRHKVSDLGNDVAFCQLWNHDGAIGIDPAGTLYYGWIDNQRVARLALSRDQGATWTPAYDVRAPDVVQAQMLELAVGGIGKVTMLYMGSTNAPQGPYPKAPATDPTDCDIQTRDPPEQYAETTWNAYIVSSWNADAEEPVFVSTLLNDPADPIARGQCRGIGCPGQGDFIDVKIAPDGTPWAAFVDACVADCATGETLSNVNGGGVAGHVVGPSLWD